MKSGMPLDVYFNGHRMEGVQDFQVKGLSFISHDERRRLQEQQRTYKRFGTYTPTKRQRELYAKKKKKSRHKR